MDKKLDLVVTPGLFYLYTNGMNQVSKTGFGVDVSATRADELEKRLLAEIRSGDTVLDLGCGAGGAAARLQKSNVYVAGIDIYDFSAEWSEGKGSFVCGDIVDLKTLVPEQLFDYCLCNRAIHYLRYDQAAQVLEDLRRLVHSQLFISFSGLTSDLAKAYDKHDTPIKQRFARLGAKGQETFGVTAPLTLYTEIEATQLLINTGWNVTWSRTTDFGNVLAVASALNDPEIGV